MGGMGGWTHSCSCCYCYCYSPIVSIERKQCNSMGEKYPGFRKFCYYNLDDVEENRVKELGEV